MKQLYFLILLLLGINVTAQTSDVTFSVDMSGYASPFTTVYVSGSFNAWSGDSNPLVDQGSGIWSVTLPLADGAYEYKFQLDQWNAQEGFSQGDVCTITNGGGNHNRYLVVSGADKTLDTAPFSSCAESAANPGPHNLTINVDMSGYGGTITTAVNINGENYNSQGLGDWCGACVPLVDQGGGIWSATIPLQEYTYQFKITVDGWTDQEMFTGGTPGTVDNGGNVNRFVQLSGDKTLNLVWNQSAILSTARNEILETSVYPNPTDTDWTIRTPNTRIKTIEVFNVLGRRVYTKNYNANEATILTESLASGIYLARIDTELGTKTMKLIKN